MEGCQKKAYSVVWMGCLRFSDVSMSVHCRVLFRRSALYRGKKKETYFDSHLASKHSEWRLFFYLMLKCELLWMQWCVSFQIAICLCVLLMWKRKNCTTLSTTEAFPRLTELYVCYFIWLPRFVVLHQSMVALKGQDALKTWKVLNRILQYKYSVSFHFVFILVIHVV